MTSTAPRPGSRRVPVLVGVAVAAGLALGVTALAGRPDAAPGAAPWSAGTAAGAPTLAFLGDSLTVGVGAPPDQGYAPQTAQALGWPVAVVDGVSGSGFLAPGAGRPMPDRVPDVVAARPDVVVVAGGTNDVFGGYDADDVGAAATALLAELRAGLPDATVVVLGPFPTSLAGVDAPSPVRDAVRDAARAAGAEWIDAGAVVASVVGTESEWDRYISEDGLHPNERGYRELADVLAAELAGRVG